MKKQNMDKSGIEENQSDGGDEDRDEDELGGLNVGKQTTNITK